MEPAFPKDVFRGYGVYNKTTGIMENSTTILPDAIRWAIQLDRMLTKALDPKEEASQAWPDELQAPVGILN